MHCLHDFLASPRLAVFTVSILLLSSLVSSKSTAADKDKRCERGVNLDPEKPPHKIQLSLPLKAPKCYWGVYGSGQCKPEISCTVDIPFPKSGSDDCTENFVTVTDGSVGEKTFCGKTKFAKLRASEGLRHLFLVISYNDIRPATGITCTAQCAKDDSGEKLTKTIDRKLEQGCACGFQNKEDRIVGGEDAKNNEFPWQAAIVYPKTRSPNCGASVINDRFVLTAAHCFWFESKRPDQVEVLVHAHVLDMTKKSNAKDVALGRDGSIRSSGYKETKRTDEDEGSTRYKVLEIINHPLFNEYYDFDYALLRLDKKIKLAEPNAPTPICLPSATAFDTELAGYEGKNLTVTGWGLAAENAGGTTRILQKLDVPYMGFAKCKESNPELVTNRMICAGYDDGVKDACTGDSGGPLIKKAEVGKQWKQVGIVSWGEGCARAGKPGVYSRITEMMQWIHLHTTEQNSVWCQEK